MIKEAITAQKSNLANIPDYLSMHIPIDDLCDHLWVTDSNVEFLVNAVGSTEEHFCRAQLTGCVANTGICLLGLHQLETKKTVFINKIHHVWFPFKNNGLKKCIYVSYFLI